MSQRRPLVGETGTDLADLGGQLRQSIDGAAEFGAVQRSRQRLEDPGELAEGIERRAEALASREAHVLALLKDAPHRRGDVLEPRCKRLSRCGRVHRLANLACYKRPR